MSSADSTVRLAGRLICADELQAEIVRRELPEHVRLTLAEEGCLAFSVTESQAPLEWEVSEEFRDAAAFRAHQERVAASRWGHETANIQRDYTITGLD